MNTPQPSSVSTPDASTLGVEAARKRLPELLERAAAGERIVIQRHRTPMAALVPLAGQAPTDPSLRRRQVQSLLGLQGSGRGCWDPNQRHPARPAPAAPAFVQPFRTWSPRVRRNASALLIPACWPTAPDSPSMAQRWWRFWRTPRAPASTSSP
ncbi:MAG: type II toxin-antitoxin system Phd/YefM family antitoxin [Cyanobacteria bacterium]|nr:type II toxin-antitoxin system Phd/YefM family antitoxin [Cyanobacteriota bacterium]MDA1205554.1 type II toxin-antitoxin system Phd/YefM family antitoxin [Cyanobacteriota bacterium]